MREDRSRRFEDLIRHIRVSYDGRCQHCPFADVVCPSQRDFYRQDQQEILSTPIKTARTLPEDILRLTGYCTNGPMSS